MDPEMSAKLREPIPSQLIKQLDGRDYISGHTAIDRLIQATGQQGWSFFIQDTKVFTDSTGKVVHVAMLGSLDIGNQRRSDWGEAISNGRKGEELFKTCQTDTIKRCARLFGVALELYGDLLDEETGEVTHRASGSRQHAPQGPQRPHGGKYAAAAANAQQGTPVDAEGFEENPYGHASEKQARFIGHLLKELEWTREDATRYLDATYGVKRISELGSRQDVSAFIEHLQAVKAQNEPAGVEA